MSASYDKKNFKTHFQSNIDSFKLMMDTFHNSVDEIAFCLQNNVLDVKSHFDEENGRKMLNTKLSILCQGKNTFSDKRLSNVQLHHQREDGNDFLF
jgi:hypothetical protein